MQFCSLFSYICYVKLKHPSQQRHWSAFHYLIFNNLLVIESINISYSCREIFCIVSVYYIHHFDFLIDIFFLIWTLHLDIFIIKTNFIQRIGSRRISRRRSSDQNTCETSSLIWLSAPGNKTIRLTIGSQSVNLTVSRREN